MMRIAFRTDASTELGIGHVMRCLTLAEALRDQGVECQFICGSQDGNMLPAIRDKGFKASSVGPFMNWKSDAEQTQAVLAESVVNWIVVDHYALDVRWEQALKAHCHKLMVIDDLADRTHNCDLLLDQNLGRLKSDYEKLVPAACQLLIGPKYALLRPEFSAWRDYSLKRRTVDPELKHLLISMGGTDYPNSTSQILHALKQVPLPTDCHITVVMGASSPWIQQVTALAKTMPWSTEVKINVSNMAELIANSDLSIGAAGVTTWERCCLGLPSLIIVTADNQRPGATAMATCGAAKLVGDIQDIETSVPRMLGRIALDFNWQQQVLSCSNICDGGGINRVLSNVHSIMLSVRPVTAADEKLLLEWANDPLTRENAINSNPISTLSHQAWLANRLTIPMTCQIFIVALEDTPIGQVRLERNDAGDWELDYALASSYRGKGLGRVMLSQALAAFGLTCHSDATVIAKVKVINTPSCNVIESLSFDIFSSAIGMNIYKKIIKVAR